jgi:hypothetical protein
VRSRYAHHLAEPGECRIRSPRPSTKSMTFAVFP